MFHKIPFDIDNLRSFRILHPSIIMAEYPIRMTNITVPKLRMVKGREANWPFCYIFKLFDIILKFSFPSWEKVEKDLKIEVS